MSKKLNDDDIKAIVESSGIDELKRAYADEHNANSDYNNDDNSNHANTTSKDHDDDLLNVKKDYSKTSENSITVSIITAIKIFLKKNAEMLYILLALFIFTEGIAITKLTKWWWVPIIGAIIMLTIMVAWKSSKVMLKALFSIIVLAFVIAFQMLFATAYTMTPTVAVLIPAVELSSYFIFISISYMIDTNVSRWGAAGMGAISGFIASYGFLSGGVIPSCLGAAFGTILGGIVWMYARNMWQRRSANMPLPPRVLDSSKTNHLKEALKDDYDVITYEKGKYPFWILLPKENEKDKIAVIQPLDFKTHIVDSAKRGLTYRHRRIGEYLYKMASYDRSKTDSNAVIMFADCTGTLKIHDIIGIELADSNDQYHVALVDLSNNSRTVRNDIIETMNRFIYPTASEKTITSLRAAGSEHKSNNKSSRQKNRKDKANA